MENFAVHRNNFYIDMWISIFSYHHQFFSAALFTLATAAINRSNLLLTAISFRRFLLRNCDVYFETSQLLEQCTLHFCVHIHFMHAYMEIYQCTRRQWRRRQQRHELNCAHTIACTHLLVHLLANKAQLLDFMLLLPVETYTFIAWMNGWMNSRVRRRWFLSSIACIIADFQWIFESSKIYFCVKQSTHIVDNNWNTQNEFSCSPALALSLSRLCNSFLYSTEYSVFVECDIGNNAFG